MGRLDNKVVYVAGAGGGIGRATCVRLLAEGASVVAADIVVPSPSAMPQTVTESLLEVQCDVSDTDSVQESFAAGVSTFGRIDAVCNLTGGSGPDDGPVTTVPLEEFWRTMRVDLLGTFLLARHGIPELVQAGGGSLVTMTSIVALKAVPGLAAYTAAKGGVISLTRSMAAEFAEHGVRVNAVAPGITLTPRVAARSSSTDPESRLVQEHLLGLVDPLDIADLIVYLVSEESRKVTGQILQVDSGATIL